MPDFQFGMQNQKIKLQSFTIFHLQIGGAFLVKVSHKAHPSIIIK